MVTLKEEKEFVLTGLVFFFSGGVSCCSGSYLEDTVHVNYVRGITAKAGLP